MEFPLRGSILFLRGEFSVSCGALPPFLTNLLNWQYSLLQDLQRNTPDNLKWFVRKRKYLYQYSICKFFRIQACLIVFCWIYLSKAEKHYLYLLFINRVLTFFLSSLHSFTTFLSKILANKIKFLLISILCDLQSNKTFRSHLVFVKCFLQI